MEISKQRKRKNENPEILPIYSLKKVVAKQLEHRTPHTSRAGRSPPEADARSDASQKTVSDGVGKRPARRLPTPSFPGRLTGHSRALRRNRGAPPMMALGSSTGGASVPTEKSFPKASYQNFEPPLNSRPHP